MIDVRVAEKPIDNTPRRGLRALLLDAGSDVVSAFLN
jgi:hypothetical protein